MDPRCSSVSLRFVWCLQGYKHEYLAEVNLLIHSCSYLITPGHSVGVHQIIFVIRKYRNSIHPSFPITDKGREGAGASPSFQAKAGTPLDKSYRNSEMSKYQNSDVSKYRNSEVSWTPPAPPPLPLLPPLPHPSCSCLSSPYLDVPHLSDGCSTWKHSQRLKIWAQN